MKKTQIVLVGHTPRRLVEGIRRVPAEKVVLVMGDKLELEGEAKVVETAEAVEALFKGIMEIERLYVDKEDILAAAQTILGKIREEIEKGAEVWINVSGSLRQMAIACYMAALVSRTSVYSVLPEYDSEFQEVGVKAIYEVPFFPIKEVAEPMMKLLRMVKAKEGIESVDQLAVEMFGAQKGEAYNRARAKVSYYVKELEAEGFIQRKREGQRVRIELTPLGGIYALGKEIRDLKRNK
jgi:CRISPR-associated protein Csa3